jgi:hypothetical protein
MRALALPLLLVAACGGSASSLPPPDPLVPDDQTPPTTTAAALDAWLAEGHYLRWRCEPTRHEARAGSGHGDNRICVNTLQATHSSTAGAFPVGSASVKELYDGDGQLEGYGVYVRAAEGDGGEKRFWYERLGSRVIADGFGHTTCIGCHGGAPQDFVFTALR